MYNKVHSNYVRGKGNRTNTPHQERTTVNGTRVVRLFPISHEVRPTRCILLSLYIYISMYATPSCFRVDSKKSSCVVYTNVFTLFFFFFFFFRTRVRTCVGNDEGVSPQMSNVGCIYYIIPYIPVPVYNPSSCKLQVACEGVRDESEREYLFYYRYVLLL